MFWICAEKSVDSTGMFLFLLSSAYTEWIGGSQAAGRGQMASTDQGDISYPWHYAQHLDWGEKEKGNI